MTVSRASVHVLGPLQVVADGQEVALPARKHRQLLAALAVAAGTSRSRGQLVEALWGELPPSSADKVLQGYVSQLRKTLPPMLEIRTTATGYALRVDAGSLDALRFEQLVTDARRALGGGDPALAASLLRQGLGLWTGAAYDEFADEQFARADASRLEDLRREALEDRIEADLALGRHTELLTELRSLAAQDLLRERLQGLTMTALYRAGQQAEALEVYRTARAALVEDLGVEPGAELQEVQRRILRQDPDLLDRGRAAAAPSELPIAINPLRGRERELAELRDLLGRDGVRLLVLTGAGGSGKTRLAVAAARDVAGEFAHGVVFVDLAPVHEAPRLLPTLHSRLGLPQSGDDPVRELAAALRSRELLLVLDNVEQLREAGPQLVELLRATSHLRLLVTSRVVLHLSGEHVYPVDPLSEDAAVALFVERAREAGARLSAGDVGDETLRLLCRRLDGLPLAIEIAAGQTRVMSPAELLDRLDARLDVVAGGPRDLPARQQTLKATLLWSYEQLDETERRALRRLAVFAGGWSLAAAEAVCETTVDQLAALVDHNLVTRTVTDNGSRFAMLETVRELASELLAADPDEEGLRRRHAEHALELAESLGLSIDALGTGAAQRHDIAVVEQANLRAAMDWALARDPELGLRLGVALEQFWVANDPREGARRIEELLTRAGPAIPLELHARVLRDLGGTLEISGDWRAAGVRYEQSFALFQQLGSEEGMLRLRHRLALTELSRRDLPQARVLVEEALELARAGGFGFSQCELLIAMSGIEFYEGDIQAAYDHQLEALQRSRELGRWPWGEAGLLATLGDLARRLGRGAEAHGHLRESLRLSSSLGDRARTVSSLAALVLLALDRGDSHQAGVLWGAIEAEEQRAFLGRWPQIRAEFADQVDAARSPELERALLAGRQLRLDEAVRYALEEG